MSVSYFHRVIVTYSKMGVDGLINAIVQIMSCEHHTSSYSERQDAENKKAESLDSSCLLYSH